MRTVPCASSTSASRAATCGRLPHRGHDIYLDSSSQVHNKRGRIRDAITRCLAALIEGCSGLERFAQGKLALPQVHVVHLASPGPAQLLHLLGVPRERMIALERDRHYAFGEVILLDFLYDFEHGLPYPQALRLIERSLAWARTEPEAPQQPGPCFVARGPAEFGRLITNGDELASVLERHGLAPVMLGERTVAEQIATWRDGQPKIATLGSDLSNLVFAPRGSSVLVRCGRLTETAPVEHRSGFAVDPECLAVGLEALLDVGGNDAADSRGASLSVR